MDPVRNLWLPWNSSLAGIPCFSAHLAGQSAWTALLVQCGVAISWINWQGSGQSPETSTPTQTLGHRVGGPAVFAVSRMLSGRFPCDDGAGGVARYGSVGWR